MFEILTDSLNTSEELCENQKMQGLELEGFFYCKSNTK